MLNPREVHRLLDELFEQEALLIGGLVAFYQPDDDLVWKLIRSLGVLRGRFLRRVGRSPSRQGRGPLPSQVNLKPHPAIVAFLRRVRRGC